MSSHITFLVVVCALLCSARALLNSPRRFVSPGLSNSIKAGSTHRDAQLYSTADGIPPPQTWENNGTGDGVLKESSDKNFDTISLEKGLDKEFATVALPAFVSLAADPLASLVDAMYVGRLGASDQAGMGIAISAQFSIAKLYNDPLLKTSTSLVAGKSGEELSASVATAILTAIVIGVMQVR